jgi:hypothetical protein
MQKKLLLLTSSSGGNVLEAIEELPESTEKLDFQLDDQVKPRTEPSTVKKVAVALFQDALLSSGWLSGGMIQMGCHCGHFPLPRMGKSTLIGHSSGFQAAEKAMLGTVGGA